MVQAADGGTKAAGPAKAPPGGSGAPATNPKAWTSAQQSTKPLAPAHPPAPPTPAPPTPTPRPTASGTAPRPTPAPPPAGTPAPAQPTPPAQPQAPQGGWQAQGSAGIGTATSTPVPTVPAKPGTPTAPYDPSRELNRLKSDGDTATFSVSAGAGVAVVTPWTGPVNVGPQAGAGYTATVKQVGGGGPGQPATSVPPKYTVTLDKNQSAGVYGTGNVAARGQAGMSATLELDAKHADRVTMTFDTKAEADRALRTLQSEAEAQTIRDVKTAITPSITVPDPVAAGRDLLNRARQDPLGTAADVLNPINQAKAAIGVGQTVVNGVVQDVKSLFNNPLTGGNGSNTPPPGTIEIPIGNPVTSLAGPALDAAAAKVGPSDADKAFLQSHVTSYETAITGQARVSLEANLGSLVSVDGRAARAGTLTQTVTLPQPAANGQPAKPGTVSYELKDTVTVDARTRAKLGSQLNGPIEKVLNSRGVSMAANGLPVKLGGGFNTVTPLATASQSVKVTFNMTPEQSAAVQAGRGEDVPGPNQMGKPASAEVTLAGRAIVPPLPGVVAPGPQYVNWSVNGSVANPADTLDQARDKLLGGNVSDTLETLARNTTLKGEATLTQQEGGNVSFVPSVSLNTPGPISTQVAEAWAIFTGQAQTDTVVARAQGSIGWKDPPAVQPPQPPVQPPVQGPPQPPAPPTPYQVAVVPHDGLNIRAQPGTDAPVLGPAYSGTFLQATGRTQTDAQGREWLEVRGPDMNRQEHAGWVASEYVERHAEGAMAPDSGRINELREQGYVAIPVKPGDTISGIALKNGADPKDAVTVNNGHVIDVDLIFPGDTVYIPGR